MAEEVWVEIPAEQFFEVSLDVVKVKQPWPGNSGVRVFVKKDKNERPLIKQGDCVYFVGYRGIAISDEQEHIVKLSDATGFMREEVVVDNVIRIHRQGIKIYERGT